MPFEAAHIVVPMRDGVGEPAPGADAVFEHLVGDRKEAIALEVVAVLLPVSHQDGDG